MRRVAVLVGLTCASFAAVAQDPCGFGSSEGLDRLAKSLSQEKSCSAAVTKMRECAWGSSADAHTATIVIAKCEGSFFDSLTPVAQKRYRDEMQLCAYQYARQEGTMYISAAAFCQVDVAARFAADPGLANRPAPRASFDCEKARTPLETAICSDIRVGRADIVLSRVYVQTLKGADKEGKATLVKSEKQWLQEVPQKCGLSAKPFSEKSLDCVRNEFEVRFTMLDSCVDSIADCLREASGQTAR